MIYLIENPTDYKFKQRATYDHDSSVDMFIFWKGKYISRNQVDKTILFNLKITMQEVLNFDEIINDSNCLLASKKVVSILSKLVPEEVQFFDAKIKCKDGILTDYKLINITQTVQGIDYEKSIYNWIGDQADGIISLKRLVLKNDCMNGYKIARLEEFHGHMLATEEIKQAFEFARVTSLRFVTPEDYYSSIYPNYAE
ncbi:MAG: DUF1629 domain-containing protein [Pseudomonadota bacterium]